MDIRTPDIILVPKGYTIEQVTQALKLCRQMGLLKENGSGAGWILFPAEAGKFFASRAEPEGEMEPVIQMRDLLREDPL